MKAYILDLRKEKIYCHTFTKEEEKQFFDDDEMSAENILSDYVNLEDCMYMLTYNTLKIQKI